MEALRECQANLVVHLHPSKAECVNEAILSELSSMLFTYNETFEGVVLAYDPKFCSTLAKIPPGIQPYFGVKLKARLLLFNPKPNMILEGEVVKITPQSINAVVLGFSAAVILDEDIRSEFKHKIKGEKEVYVSKSNKKHKIKVGTILRFVVKRNMLESELSQLVETPSQSQPRQTGNKQNSFDEETLHLSGSLMADNTGCARWLDRNLDKRTQADSTSKKRNIKEEEDINPKNEPLSDAETPAFKNNDQMKKSKKKRKEHS